MKRQGKRVYLYAKTICSQLTKIKDKRSVGNPKPIFAFKKVVLFTCYANCSTTHFRSTEAIDALDGSHFSVYFVGFHLSVHSFYDRTDAPALYVVHSFFGGRYASLQLCPPDGNPPPDLASGTLGGYHRVVVIDYCQRLPNGRVATYFNQYSRVVGRHDARVFAVAQLDLVCQNPPVEPGSIGLAFGFCRDLFSD